MKTHVHTHDALRPGLTKALLVYETHETAFVTVHQACVRKGRADIAPGVPASRAALAELARKLANATALSGFIPSALLYMSPRVICWWRPAAPARVFFEQPERPRKEERLIGTRNGITPQPHLVFAVTASDWYVWAVATTATAPKPTPASSLFNAPYFNVWKDGKICTGNVKLPDVMTPEVLGDYETAFFGSNFTHPNDALALSRHPRGPFQMWRELLDGKRKEFPIEWLMPLKHGDRAGGYGKAAAKEVTLAEAVKVLEDPHGA